MLRIFIITICLLTGCMKDAFEPNNFLKDAKQVELGSPFKLSIYPEKDIDYFKLNVPLPGYLEFSAGIEKPANMKLEVKVYNQGGEIIKSKTGMPIRFSIGAGDVIFSINAVDSKIYSKELFPMTVSFKDVNLDSYEPNNEISEAKAIEAGSTAAINIFPIGDMDFFKVVLYDTGFLNVGYDFNKPANLNLCASVFDENGRLLIQDSDLPAKFPLRKGIYVFGIRDIYNNESSDIIFNLSFDMQPVALDRSEPNDSIDTAKKVNFNSSSKINIFPIGDSDYFKVHTSFPGTIKLEAGNDVPQQLNLVGRIFDQEGRVLAGFARLPVSLSVEKNRDYFVSISDELDDAASEKNFSIYIKVVQQK